MKQTIETVCLNGYGSGDHDSRSMEQKLRLGDIDAMCVDFCCSFSNPEFVADIIDGKKLKTHSAGFTSLKKAVECTEWEKLPTEVIGVAAPVKRWVPGLIADARKILHSSALEAKQNSGIRKEIALQTYGLASELIRHPRHNFSVVHQIARGGSLEFAAKLVDEHDIPVSLVFSEEDEFFNLRRHAIGTKALETAFSSGVKIFELPGHHVDFTRRPIEVLEAVQNGIGRVSLEQLFERASIELPSLSQEPIPA